MFIGGDSKRINRRTVLKSIGTGASLTGVVGLGAANTGAKVDLPSGKSYAMRRAVEAFMTDETVQQALSDYGGPVQKQLTAEGITVTLDTAEFDDVRIFPERDDGVPTAHIVAEREDPDRKIEIHVLPQAGRAFAFEKTASGLRRFDADSVKPAEFCETSTYCDGYCQCSATGEDCYNCDAGWEEEERCCTYSDGSTSCEIIDSTCVSDCAPSC